MTARNIDKRRDNVLIGAGEVYIDLLDRAGKPTGELYLGDAVSATLTIATEETTVFSGTGPIAVELARIPRSVTRSFGLTLHDIAMENLALFVVGAVEALDAAAAVADEPAIVRPGRWYQLGGADRPAGALKLATPANKAAAIAAVTVATTAEQPVTAVQAIAAKRFDAGATETEQKGQFIVDYERARIFWLPADHELYAALAGIEAGTGVQIDYTPADGKRDQVRGALTKQQGAFRYIEDAAEGQGRNFYAPLCSLIPAGDLTLLDGRSSEQQVRLTVSALEPRDDRSPLYIDGQVA